MRFTIDRIDHVVLNVKDVEISAAWYQRVLGMEREDFGPDGRTALKFGGQKINLRPTGTDQRNWPTGATMTARAPPICASSPRHRRTTWSATCTIAAWPSWRARWSEPARWGRSCSVYCRDPDGNLVEIASYRAADGCAVVASHWRASPSPLPGVVPLANWMIQHVGTVCVPHGPCLVPVAPGLMAPSGVLTVGVALVLRDVVQRCLGLLWGLLAIAARHRAVDAGGAGSAGDRLGHGVRAQRTGRLRRLHAAAAAPADAGGGRVVHARAGGRFDRVPVAGVRQPGVPAGQVVGKLWAVLFASRSSACCAASLRRRPDGG